MLKAIFWKAETKEQFTYWISLPSLRSASTVDENGDLRMRGNVLFQATYSLLLCTSQDGAAFAAVDRTGDFNGHDIVKKKNWLALPVIKESRTQSFFDWKYEQVTK